MYKKKSLGQHFLHSAHYLSLIVDTADIKKGQVVVEIGPGDGALTTQLLERGAVVVAIEKDTRLIEVLKQKFVDAIAKKRFFLYEADALQFDISNCKKMKGSYMVVANIPYYITGALLKKLLTEKKQPAAMVLLVQKEVAERITRSTKESILSLSVKVYGTPTYVKTVPSGAFAPPPKVDSAILKIDAISRAHFGKKSDAQGREERFFELVRAGFAQKRKLLRRNLEKVLGMHTQSAMEHAGIPANARAEDVGLMQWLALLQ